MDKKQVQQRVSKNGKPLALSKFTWCERSKTFATAERGLVLDFSGVDHCTFDTKSGCTFDTSSDCTFKTGHNCTFKTGSDCTFKTNSGCTFDTSSDCTFKTGHNCTFKTGSDCTFDTGSYCTFNTSYDCTFDTGCDCTFKTGSSCTFKTGSDCTFKTGSYCTFNTSYDCTFDTGCDCTFKTGCDCVIVRRDIFAVIQPKEGDIIQTLPHKIKGHLINGKLDGVPHIIADGMLSKIINQKGDLYKVVNHNETTEIFIIKQGDIYSHGATVEEARASLMYKISNRDTSEYDDMTVKTEFDLAGVVKMYRTITGACESGTRGFVEANKDKIQDKFTVADILKLTKGQFGNEVLVKFMEVK